MDLILFLTLALIVFIIVLIFITMERYRHSVLLTIGVLIVFSIIFVSVVSSDVYNLKKNFVRRDKLIILEDGDKFLTALMVGEEKSYLTDDQLLTYTTYLKEEYYDKMADEYYKLIFVDIEAVKDVEESIIIKGKSISKNYLISALTSDDPYSFLQLNNVFVGDLFMEPPSDVENDRIKIKAALLGVIYDSYVEEPSFFVEQYKEGNIEVYPQTAFFSFISILPKKTCEKLAEKFMS